MSETVTADKVVIFHYTLTNNAGDVIDESVGSDPMPYLHGHDNIVPGLEAQMLGKTPGDKFTAVVQPEDGYGERIEIDAQKVPKDAFPEDFPFDEGEMIQADVGDGEVMTLWICGVEGEFVLLDPNHPLAGEVLNFEVEIVDIRNANEDELAHGHPHGIAGDEGHH